MTFRPETPVNEFSASATQLARRCKMVLAQLADAYDVARQTGGSLWDFAVEISTFLGAGLTVNDLRWMACKGYVEHAVEVSRPEDTARRFRRSRNLGFHARTCFVATEAGLRAAAPSGEPAVASDWASEPVLQLGGGAAARDGLTPCWDDQRRILRLGDRIVKHFRVPSPSQEAILRAFEEERWPAAIDDPLPPQPGQDAKRRLRATLQSLNGSQNERLVRFRGDGSGERIVWELTSDALQRHVPMPGRHSRAA